jgi:hypothetical protein
MKQRRPRGRKSRKPDKPQPTTPVAWGWQSPLEPPPRPRRTSHAALTASSGIVEPPLPLREAPVQADLKGDGGLRADATVVRAAAPHAEMLAWTAALKSLLAHVPTRLPARIGHNQPDPITHDDLLSIEKAIIVLEHQPEVPTAPDDVKAVQSTLQMIAGRLGTYLDASMMELSKSVGKELGKQLARAPYWLAVWYVLQRLDQALTGWLH